MIEVKDIEKLLNNEKSLKALLLGWKNGEEEACLEALKLVAELKKTEFSYLLIEGAYFRYREKELKEFIKRVFDVEISSPLFKFQFPVESKGDGELVNAFAAVSKENYALGKESLLLPVEGIVKSKIFFIYDREFVGDSFQAPLAYTLLFEKIPNEILITGKLFPNGNFIGELKEAKEKAAKKFNKFLIWKGNIYDLEKVFRERELPLLVATGKKEENVSFFKELSEKRNFKPIPGFADENNLIVELPYPLPKTEWYPYLKSFRKTVKELRQKFSNKLTLHIGLKTPITYSLGAGAVLGIGKVPTVIYHYQDGKYYEIINLKENGRKIKHTGVNFEYLKIEKELKNKSKEAIVGLQIASHEVLGKVKSLAKELKVDWYYVYTPELKGNLPLNVNWEKIVAELYKALNLIYQQNYKKINLIISLPNPIAFALGMAVGNYWNVEVWSYFKDSNDYFPVFNLNKVENIT